MIKVFSNKTFCALLIMLLAGTCLASPEKLDAYKKTYEDSLAKINTSYTTSALDLQKVHIQNMQALQTNMQKKGKLEEILAIKKETERFEADPAIDKARLSDIPELKMLQEDYLEKMAGLPLAKAKQIISLAEKYDKALETYQTNLTKAGKLEDAILVKKEREAVQQRPEITSSNFVVQEDNASKPKPALKEDNLLDIDPEPVVKKAEPKAVAKKWTGKTENYIKKRFDKLGDCVKDQDWAEAKEYIDPEAASRANDNMIKSYLHSKFHFFKREDSKRVKVSVEKVTLNEEETSATLIPKVYFNNRWHSLGSQDWKLHEGDWYLTYRNGGGQNSNQQKNDFRGDKQNDRRRPPWKR